ncbi:hypothetical protein MNBD_GAMMA20-1535 [hydrothermal vent metagenome]|uniref:Response regulatory domain-containing protein n=1 Tax=hydrothermal vent metagenome TaxID=652676 RepID=A0A3B1B2H7_9ZZZZ
MAKTPALPRILLVDDEPAVLEGLQFQLRKCFDISTAANGLEGLAKIGASAPFAIVLSDMRMPRMDGAEFLTRVRQAVPDTVRVLLTGQTDIHSAIAVVNEGQIFRFLTKPCPPEQLHRTLEDAARQHQLLTAERDLLEKTLHGSISALMDVLALTNAVAFGRATRIRQIVSELCDELDILQRWQVEVAAMVSQLGAITLPEETAKKLYYGEELSTDEQQLVESLPEVVARLLGNIPRLEPVLALLAGLGKKPPRDTADNSQERDVLRIALDFDALSSRGLSPQACLDTLRGHAKRYDKTLLQALAHCRGKETDSQEIQEIQIQAVREGMVFAEDVHTHTGTLLVPRGYQVTASFMTHVKAFKRGYVQETVAVIVANPDLRRSAGNA